MVSSAQKLKVEAERLDVMEKAAGVIAELLFDGNILQQIKEYRKLLLLVCFCVRVHGGGWGGEVYLLLVCSTDEHYE